MLLRPFQSRLQSPGGLAQRPMHRLLLLLLLLLHRCCRRPEAAGRQQPAAPACNKIVGQRSRAGIRIRQSNSWNCTVVQDDHCNALMLYKYLVTRLY